MEELLKKLYYSLDSPACYSGIDRLWKEAKKTLPNIKNEEVEEFLSRQRTYTLYRDVKRKGPKLKTIPCYLNTDWHADLAILSRISAQNDGHNYLLVCIDVFSRKIYVEPVKTKTPRNMINAFENIFERSKIIPWRIATDKGLEFQSKQMLAYWKKRDLQKLTPENPLLHATMAERAIRTIKDRLYKMMSQTNSTRWIDKIQQLVSSINHSVNKTTGMKPVDINYGNAKELYNSLYRKHLSNDIEVKARFISGDKVRIEKHKAKFDKGDTKFTDEIFIIDKVFPKRIPIVYRLKDLKGEPIIGFFYQYELGKTSEDTTWRIEILKERMRRGQKEYFVHWIGHSRDQDSWIAAKDIA